MKSTDLLPSFSLEMVTEHENDKYKIIYNHIIIKTDDGITVYLESNFSKHSLSPEAFDILNTLLAIHEDIQIFKKKQPKALKELISNKIIYLK